MSRDQVNQAVDQVKILSYQKKDLCGDTVT